MSGLASTHSSGYKGFALEHCHDYSATHGIQTYNPLDMGIDPYTTELHATTQKAGLGFKPATLEVGSWMTGEQLSHVWSCVIHSERLSATLS